MVDRLSPRQLQIAAMIADGWNTEEIAEQLDISRYTVRNYVRELRKLTGARDMWEIPEKLQKN